MIADQPAAVVTAVGGAALSRADWPPAPNAVHRPATFQPTTHDPTRYESAPFELAQHQPESPTSGFPSGGTAAAGLSGRRLVAYALPWIGQLLVLVLLTVVASWQAGLSGSPWLAFYSGELTRSAAICLVVGAAVVEFATLVGAFLLYPAQAGYRARALLFLVVGGVCWLFNTIRDITGFSTTSDPWWYVADLGRANFVYALPYWIYLMCVLAAWVMMRGRARSTLWACGALGVYLLIGDVNG